MIDLFFKASYIILGVTFLLQANFIQFVITTFLYFGIESIKEILENNKEDK